MTKEQQIRERLVDIMAEHINPVACGRLVGLAACDLEAAAMAILREFALRPVSQGRVDSETGEVT